MRRRDDVEVAAWLAKADGDLRMARFAVGHVDPLFDQACFHAQPAAEKALKGLVVALEVEPQRTHDLLVLLAGLRATLPDAATLEGEAELLSNYSVGPRYPSFLAAETEEEAHAAIAAATTVVQWVLARVQ